MRIGIEDLGPLLLPSTVEGDFLSSPTPSTSPPSIRSISQPPAAAPAAGGRGITGSWRVHSVGSSRMPAGGALEVVAWPEWLVAVAVLSSVGGAPWSSAADLLPWSCPRLLGAARRVNNLPPASVTADPDLVLQGADVRNRALASMALDGGPPGLRFVDFPAVGRLLPIQGSSGGVAAARRRYVPVVVFGSGVHRGCCVIFFFGVDFSVRTLF
jgi:hypothetical protein